MILLIKMYKINEKMIAFTLESNLLIIKIELE